LRAVKFSIRHVFGLTALAAVLLAAGNFLQLFWWGTLILFGPLFLMITFWRDIPPMLRTTLVVAYVVFFVWVLSPDVQ
jgi:hypothetical protein